MRIRVLCISVLVIVLCLIGTTAGAVLLIYDDFNSNAVGAGVVPTGWTQSQTWTPPFCSIYEDSPPDKYVGLYDANDTTGNNALIRTFANVSGTSGTGSGTVTMQMDLMLAQTGAGYLINLADGAPTMAGNCPVRIIFEGNVKWASDGGAGTISYLTGATSPYTLVTFKDEYGAPITYTANTWYTLRVEANLNTGRYHAFLGPKGGTLVDIGNNTEPGGIPLATPKVQLNRFGINSSVKKNGTTPESEGTFYLDNVDVNGDADFVACNTVAEAKTTILGKIVQLTDKIVTAGAGQLTGDLIYIQDDTGGIRIRPFPPVDAKQGDKITVTGTLKRASEGGDYVKYVGEKEIQGMTQITVTPGPFPLPKPLFMTNKTVGGGDFGMEPAAPDSDGFPSQPGVYAADGTDPVQQTEAGLCNIGRYVRVCGRVLYSDPQHYEAGSFFYIDDGSHISDGSHFPTWGPDDPPGTNQVGLRIHPKSDALWRLMDVEGKYAIVTGIVGAIGASDSPIHTGNSTWYYCNCRVIRPVEETFTDTNGDYTYNLGEPFEDTNGNGIWDGMIFLP